MVIVDKRVEALYDIWAFADLINFKGGSKSFSKVHKEMTDINCRPQTHSVGAQQRRRLFLVHRECLKSTINLSLYLLWRTYRNPNIRVLVGTNVKDLAESFIRELRSYYEDEDLQENVWNNRPHIPGPMVPVLSSRSSSGTESKDKKVKWTNSEVQLIRTKGHNYKEATITTLSCGQRKTGYHVDLLVLDDIVDWDNSITPQKARKIDSWADDLESLLTQKPYYMPITESFGEWLGDEVVINGTPYYPHDYYCSRFFSNDEAETAQRLKEMEYVGFFRNIYVNGKDETDGFTFPEKFDSLSVGRLQKRMKSKRRYASQYLLQLIPDDESAMDSGLLQYMHPEDFDKRDLGKNFTAVAITNPDTGVREMFPLMLHMVTDLAISSAAKADECAIVVGGRDAFNNVRIVDKANGKWSPSEHVEQVYKMARKWRMSRLYIEKVGYQESFAFTMKSYFHKPGYFPMSLLFTSPKGEKTERITSTLEPLLSAHMLYVMNWMAGTEVCQQIDMLGISGIHDDVIDCITNIALVSHATNQRLLQGPSRGRAYRPYEYNKTYGGIYV